MRRPGTHGAKLAMLVVTASLGPVVVGGATEKHEAGIQADVKDIGAKLDEYVQAEVKSHHFSGAVLVAKDGHILLAKGYGYANAEWQIPNTPQTKFRLGSITKQFTATAIMQLREKRLLDLQDSICKYLNPCVEAWKPVTLHHLLSHTSGISGYGDKPDAGSQAIPPWTQEQIAASFRDKPLDFPPGTRWKYSDWGYCLLGMVIERVTGKTYEEVLREQIFEPLGMNDTGYDRSESILKQRAGGYRLDGDKLLNAKFVNMAIPYAAGALYSTAEDLYKWDQSLYSNSVLPQEALDLMWTDISSNYGYGWMVSRPGSTSSRTPFWALPNHFEIAHTGAIDGFTTEILRLPNDRTVVIVLANLEDAHILGPALAAMVFGEKFSLPE